MKNKILLLLIVFSFFTGCSKKIVAPQRFDNATFENQKIETMYFEDGKSAISGKGYSELVNIMSFIKVNSNDNFIIEGYSDDYSEDDKNLCLSRERVAELFKHIKGFGLDITKFSFSYKVGDGIFKSKQVDLIISK
jgi:outer membrane protein OmpA-like peptidoglycan-associated protein